jgi:hypothetical protein
MSSHGPVTSAQNALALSGLAIAVAIVLSSVFGLWR